MIINISIDDQLIDAAMALGNHSSKKDAATVALEKYVERLKRQASSQTVNAVYDDAKVSNMDPRETD